jgi:hypothetical protein
MKTQYVESLVVEVDVRYKLLFKASELLLLLLRHDDKPIGIPQSMWGGADDLSSGEVGRAAPPYIHEVR